MWTEQRGEMSTIRHYMAWAEKRIARLVIQEGLHVGLLKVVQGPLTITFQVRLVAPSLAAVGKLLRMGDAIAEAIQVEAVRIARSSGAFSIEIPAPIQRTPSSLELLRHSQGIKVCVGLDNLRQPVFADLRQHGALLWVGPSRRGKTQSMKCTLYCLARQKGSRFKYVILCHERKREDWQVFAQAIGCMGIVTTPMEHSQVMQWASTILLKMRTPFTFAIVVDDLLNLLEEAPEMASHLARLSSLGAGLGVHLLAGTQAAGSKRGTGGEGVEANASAKILYKATSKARAARNAGQGEIDLTALTGAKGDAVLLIDGIATRIATGYADERDILQLPTGPQYQTPWRQQIGSTADSTPHAKANLYTGTRTTCVLDNTSGTGSVLGAPLTDDWATAGSAAEDERADSTFSTNRMGGTSDEPTLPDGEPDAHARAYLRALYRKYGSKNQVLKVAWGGVVNQDGKTPKTWKWLKAALAESEEPTANSASFPATTSMLPSDGKAHIDLRTPEGRATVDHLITQGLLPRDEITEVVVYQRKGG